MLPYHLIYVTFLKKKSFPTSLPRCLLMSSISLKTSSLLSHLGHQALLRATCVWAKEQAKSFHTILNIPKPHFPPHQQQMGSRRRGHVCFAAVCALPLPATTCSAPKMSKNSLDCPLLLTGGDRHFFTDTLCPNPLLPPSVNCCWRPASLCRIS